MSYPEKMVNAFRKINFFEVVLLFVGIGVGIVGFMMIKSLYQADPVLSWDLYQTVFIWLLLIVVLILAATTEDVKEELAILIKEQVEETKLLKELNNSQLEEIRLMRQELTTKVKKKK